MSEAGEGLWLIACVLVPAARGASVCTFPKPACVCLVCAGKLQAGPAGDKEALGMDQAIR